MADTDPSAEDTIKTILVVEDDPGVGEMLVAILKAEGGYHALLTTDGARALETVNTLTPDLVLLDYRLPGMNGLELSDRLHALETLQQTPVLLVSANLPEREIEKRQIASLKKPFELDVLLHLVETLLVG